MKQRNRYRSERRGQNIRLLEKALSLRDRLFSLVALRRGLRRLRYWAIVLVLAAAVGAGMFFSGRYAVGKAYSLSMDKVSFESPKSIISKEQALEILGLEGSGILATLDVSGREKKLQEFLCIDSDHMRADLPDTLHIELDERVPIVYVEMESGISTGKRTRLFMCPNGVLFPVVPEYHRNFLNAPTWYLQPGDVSSLKPGAVVAEEIRRPILELVKAANAYDLAELPRIHEIFRPKDWKINVTLEDGVVVEMQVYEIREQMERLTTILEHTRATKRHAASINVIPRLNPTVIYRSTGEPTPTDEADKENDKGKDKTTSARNRRR